MYPLKFEPILKQTLWGGDKIIPFKHLNSDLKGVGESWEISGVEDNESVVANGPDKGLTLADMVRKYREELVGEANYARFGNKFPLLIKFIDAKQDLSIQVHPTDELAKKRHNSMGKTEMWYVVDSEPGSYLYCGLKKNTDKEEIERRIADNTITDILNKIEVKKGDVVMVKAGTIHAIGAGIIICEIQQNSNCTYRMYDYDRRDKYGNPRELHVKKALDVVDTKAYVKDNTTEVMLEENEHYSLERLVQCKYFECLKYEIKDEVKIVADESSFVSLVFIEGSGTIEADDYKQEVPFKAGESFFVSSGKRSINIKGKGTCIVTHV